MGWDGMGWDGMGFLVGTWGIYVPILFLVLARVSGTSIGVRLSSQKAPTVHKSLKKPKAHQSWTHVLTHQIWVLAVLMYPKTCPTHSHAETTCLTRVHTTNSAHAPQLKLSRLRHLLSRSTIPPSNSTTRWSSLMPSTAHAIRHLKPLHRSGAQNVHAMAAHK